MTNVSIQFDGARRTGLPTPAQPLNKIELSLRFVFGLAIGIAGLVEGSAIAQVHTKNPITSTSLRCITSAARYHKVNHDVLSAILRIESSYNPGAINRNSDGSVDIGIGQMNSVHFKELSAHGITPTDLMDPCVGSYVAAWHLGRQVQRFGNTWFAIGAYHSVTPTHNSRYQALVYNAMIDMRVLRGPKLKVPSVKLP